MSIDELLQSVQRRTDGLPDRIAYSDLTNEEMIRQLKAELGPRWRPYLRIAISDAEREVGELQSFISVARYLLREG